MFQDFSYYQFVGYLAVLMRASALMLTLPFFSSNNIPSLVKAGLSLSLAIWLYPTLNLDLARIPTEGWTLAVYLGGELMIGAILGLMVRIILAAVQMMGMIAGFQMGFAVANVMDPMSGEQVSVLAQICYIVALLCMFMVNGHLMFMQAFADSFRMVPPGEFGLSRNLYEQVVAQGGNLFAMCLKLGFPVIAALLFTQVALGVLAKTVPQMNILMVGFPITITIGMLFMSLALGVMVPMIIRIFHGLPGLFNRLLAAM